MNFQPIDEMSLRHLFSSCFGEDLLKMAYIGPVLNPSNIPETSPDCLILDKRSDKWKILRCEFKFIPIGKIDFEHNGKFDIAIIWDLPPSLKKDKLQSELLIQNGCHEILVFNEIKAFRDLPKYTTPNSHDFDKTKDLERVILKVDFPIVYCAYIAAKIYPNPFRIDKMTEILKSRFPTVAKMHPTGRANIVSALLQTKPPLIKKLYNQVYRWDNGINSIIAANIIGELIQTRFEKDLPDSDTIDLFKRECFS